MKFRYYLSALLLLSLADASAQRAKYNFNGGWKVQVGDAQGAEAPAFADASWKSVTLPWAWNEDEAFKKDIAELSDSISWYRKHFRLPATARGHKVFLEFEGIRQAGEFYLNGKRIGLHENGVTAFGFDVTDAVNFDGENVLSARIDNNWDYREKASNSKYQWEDRNFNANYGGINKNVYLHIAPKVYQTLPLYSNLGTTGVYVYADNFNIKGRSATIHTASEVKNESGRPQQVSYEVRILDGG
ncbi:sugar-binding domain-containing protein, partial [Paraflavisolibacter sp. H34]|uniref:sugar-binding domain-containing protein n=1 Tax=Huijunlia imazamoxiresistens TaxID=3127457 RepID=UPI0030189B6A